MATGSKIDMRINVGTIVALVALVAAALSGFYSWRLAVVEKDADFASRLNHIEKVIKESSPQKTAKDIVDHDGRLSKIETAVGSSSPRNHKDSISSIEARIAAIESLIETPSPRVNAQNIASLREDMDSTKTRIQSLPIVPPNIVIASTQECTGIWEPYSKAEGQFILGVGKGQLRQGVVSGQEGGSPFITLDEINMPRHQHATIIHANPIFERQVAQKADAPTIGWGFQYEEGISTFSIVGPRQWKKGTYFYSGPAGSGVKKTHLPPFVALYFCKLKMPPTESQ